MHTEAGEGHNAAGASTSPSSAPARDSYGLRQRNYNSMLTSSSRKEGAKRKDASTPLSQQHLGTPKRPRNPATLSVDELELQVGVAVGLDDMQPEEEEVAMLPAGSDLDAYIKVRNHVLTRWRSDVRRYLGPDEAASRILAKFKPLVIHAWKFLSAYGYINFGVARPLLKEPERSLMVARAQRSVIVIGAGLAGAAAARQLAKWGFRVVLLEGRNRPGGRVWSSRMEGGGRMGIAELGGQIITGIDGNPLAVLAHQLGVGMHEIKNRCPLYLEDGSEAPADLDQLVLEQHNALLDGADKFRDELPPDVADSVSVGAALRTLWAQVPREPGQEALQEQLMRWHFANVEFANAAKVATLSLRHWDQDDPYEMEGAHVFLPGGNIQLVHGLLQGVPVFYNSVVNAISHGPQGVTVTTSDAVFKADAALVTVPLGVLKKGVINFSPPLPEAKQSAIRRLGFGVLNKLALLFPAAFWDTTLDTIGHVSPHPEDAGLFFLFYAYAPTLAGDGAVLAALVSGEAAERFEQLPIEQAVARLMRILRTIYTPQGIEVPEPLQAAATRWASDPMSCGSYSSVAVGCTGDDYEALAADVGGRLFFGGEATIAKWPATMHGAFISGLREAAKIREVFGPRGRRVASPPVGAEGVSDGSEDSSSSSSEDDDGAVEVESSSEGEGVGHARRRSRQRRAVRNARPTALVATQHAPPTAESLAEVASMSATASALRTLFAECEPDVEFGCISALYGPPATPFADRALVQVDFGGMRTGPRRDLAVYACLSRVQLSALRDVRGGDEARLAALSRDLGVKLVGRGRLGAGANALLREVARARGKPELLQLLDMPPAAIETKSPATATAAAKS